MTPRETEIVANLLTGTQLAMLRVLNHLVAKGLVDRTELADELDGLAKVVAAKEPDGTNIPDAMAFPISQLADGLRSFDVDNGTKGIPE